MSDASHPYAGRNAVLATMHRKEEAIAPVFLSTLGLSVSPGVRVDTDQLGTFSGDVPRVGSMLEVAVRKARLGMPAMNMSLGLASEGSFGPHPSLPFLHAGMELLAFVDDERCFVVHESLVADSSNFHHAVVLPGDGLEGFLARVGFPGHGLLVRPNQGPRQSSCVKGVVDRDRLVRAIAAAAAESTDFRARLETTCAHISIRPGCRALGFWQVASRSVFGAGVRSAVPLGSDGPEAGSACRAPLATCPPGWSLSSCDLAPTAAMPKKGRERTAYIERLRNTALSATHDCRSDSPTAQRA